MSVEKLKQIFAQDFSAKRVKKEVDLIAETPNFKRLVDIKYVFIIGQIFTSIVTLKEPYFESLPHNIRPKENLEFRITYTKHYPHEKPKVHIASKSLNQYHTVSCRDYLNDLCSHWTAKIQLLDLIKMLLPFYKKIIEIPPINHFGVYTRGEYIEIGSITPDSEIHFATFKMDDKPQKTRLVFNRMDLILLQLTSLSNYCRIAQVFPIRTIKSMYTKKRNPKQLMIFIKWGQKQGGFEFETDSEQHAQKIIESILQKKKQFQVEYKQIEQQFKQKYETKQQQTNPNPNASPIKNSKGQSIDTNATYDYLQKLNEQIMVVESILQKSYSDAQLTNLISLYKKGVQFCSAYNISNFNIYLKKLQQLLVRQQTQALMNSTKSEQKNTINESIFDFFEDNKPQ